MNMNALPEAALVYAKLGWHVFPCAPNAKTPITQHGVKDATINEDQIRLWWNETPNANIALACGKASGICVIDVDVKEKENGWATLESLSIELPKSITQKTPRGGAHFFYQYEPLVKNENSKRFPGIDIRTNGYYVILPPSVHPNGLQYQWENNLDPWSCQPATFPVAFLPSTNAATPPPWAFVSRKPPDESVAPRATASSTHNVLKRASLYLAVCDPAVQGQGGHNKLLWAAVALVHGFKLSDAQAYELLRTEYNPRCDPPWDLSDKNDHKDFVRKVSEARKLTPDKPIGWLLEDDSYLVMESIFNDDDIQEIIDNAGIGGIVLQPTEEDFSKPPNEEIEFLSRPIGLLGRICSHLNKTSLKYQPMLSLGCALTFLGVLFGRKIKDELDTRTNLYCMGIAPSGSGKNHAPKQLKRLMLESGIMDLFGGDDFASDSGIEKRMALCPSTVFLCDEIGHLMRAIKKQSNPHTMKITGILLKLYSSSGDVYRGRVYADSDKQQTVVQPCCGVWGTSTKEMFLEGLSIEEVQNGWLSRCLVFQSEDDPEKNRNWARLNFPKDIIEDVYRWYIRKIEPSGDGNIDIYVNARITGVMERPPEQLVIPTRESAEKIFIELNKYADKRAKQDLKLSILWKRCEENARKIALIVAAGNSYEKPEITGGIADYACRLVKCLTDNLVTNLACDITSSVVESKKLQILHAVRQGEKRGCPQWALTQNTRNLTKRERNEFIDDLIEGRELIRKLHKIDESRKAAFVYWIPEYFPRELLKEENE